MYILGMVMAAFSAIMAIPIFGWALRILVYALMVPFVFDKWMLFFHQSYTMPWFVGAIIGFIPVLGSFTLWFSTYLVTLILSTWVLV